MPQYLRKQAHRAVHRRIRKKLTGTSERPRLAVHFSGRHVYAQIIDDVRGHTLASASTAGKSSSVKGATVKSAEEVGRQLADRAREQKVTNVVFDRGGFVYHGKVKALADAARAGGLQF